MKEDSPRKALKKFFNQYFSLLVASFVVVNGKTLRDIHEFRGMTYSFSHYKPEQRAYFISLLLTASFLW